MSKRAFWVLLLVFVAVGCGSTQKATQSTEAETESQNENNSEETESAENAKDSEESDEQTDDEKDSEESDEQTDNESAAEKEEMPEIGGTKLHYRTVGQGDPIVLLHGGPGGNLLTFRDVEGELATDYRLIMYDQRGSGESERLPIDVRNQDPSLMSADRHVEDLEEIRQKLGIDKLVLLGHSWGATLGILYAAKYPTHVKRLILANGGPVTPELAEKKKAEIERRMPDDVNDAYKAHMQDLQANIVEWDQDKLDAWLLDMLAYVMPAMSCGWEESTEWGKTPDVGRGGFWANFLTNKYQDSFDKADFQKKLEAVEAPTLLISGKCEVNPLERQKLQKEALPDAELVVFQESGHQPQDEQPELFMETVQAFLQGKELPMDTVE